MQFRFSVGPQRRECTIHSALVAACSPALDKLVNGEFMEAQDLYAELESINEETFILFSQYAYTGDYNREMPKEAKSFIPENPRAGMRVAGPKPMSDAPDDIWGRSPGSKKAKCKRGKNISEEVKTAQRDKAWSGFKNEHSAALPARRDWPATESCAGNAILSHAQLYVFADYYGISGLMDLSFCRLKKTQTKKENNNNKKKKNNETQQKSKDKHAPSK